MLKNVILKSVHNKNIKTGDKVCLLCKTYGFNGISRAYLRDCVYLGKGQWGYEFKDCHPYPWMKTDLIWRFKNPEAVLLKGAKQ